MASTDAMAVYVKQLLELDEQGQRDTLETLSMYADKKAQGGLAIDGLGQSGQPWTLSGKLDLDWSPDAKAPPPSRSLPARVDAASCGGLASSLPAKKLSNNSLSSASEQLLQAATLLQSALSNWESCLQTEETKRPLAMLQKQSPQPWQPEEQAMPNVRDTCQRLLDDAKITTSTFDTQNAQSTKLDTMRWLVSHLEHKQAESMQKLSGLLSQQQQSELLAALPQHKTEMDSWNPRACVAPSHQSDPLASANGPAFLPLPPREWWNTTGPPGSLGATTLPTVPPYKGARQTGHAAPGAWGAARGTQPKAKLSETSGTTGDTLRMHLKSLLNIESSRVLIVRKINRLGFGSADALKSHYSWYGKVESVLVAHSRVKSNLATQSGLMGSRLRPSGLGFIVMSTCAEAQSILAEGSEQVVLGVLIRVQQFERRMSEDVDAEEQEPEAESSPGVAF